MKRLLLVLISIITLWSCDEKQNKMKTSPEYTGRRTIVSNERIEKIVKAIKETNEVSTSMVYKYDVWNGKMVYTPTTTSTTKYYIVYTDGTIEETTKENGMFYSKGDTVVKIIPVYK